MLRCHVISHRFASFPFWQHRHVMLTLVLSLKIQQPSSCSLSTTMATSVLQRPYRGSRVSSFYPVKSLPPISSLDSAFQLQEYISLLIRLDVHDVDAIVSLPGRLPQKDQDETLDSLEPDSKKSEDGDRKSDISVDRPCWIYEQLRSAKSNTWIRVPSVLMFPTAVLPKTFRIR